MEQVAQPESKLDLGRIEEAKKEWVVFMGSMIGEDPGRSCSVQQCGQGIDELSDTSCRCLR